MHVRSLAIGVTVITTLALGACDSDGRLGVGAGSAGRATVRLINATAMSLDIATAGAVPTGNGALGFGTSSTCISVDAVSPNLVVRQTGTSTVLAGLAPSFQSGGNYSVIAYQGAGSTAQFAVLSNAFTPSTGQAGLRVFNGASAGSSYDVYVTTPGAALGTSRVNNVGFGSGSSYFNVGTTAAQQVRITSAGSQTVVLDVGNQTFTAGSNTTLVIAPATPGSLTPRAFFVQGC
jgi:hypothetical protein